MVRTLDTKLKQCLVDFFADPNFSWHHRELLVKLDACRWVVATPDHSVQRRSLSMMTSEVTVTLNVIYAAAEGS